MGELVGGRLKIVLGKEELLRPKGEASRRISPQGTSLKGAEKSMMGWREGVPGAWAEVGKALDICLCASGLPQSRLSLQSTVEWFCECAPGTHGKGNASASGHDSGDGPVPCMTRAGVGRKTGVPIHLLSFRRRLAGERMHCICWCSQRMMCPISHWMENWEAWCSHMMASAT